MSRIIRNVGPSDLNLMRDSFALGLKTIATCNGMPRDLPRRVLDGAIMFGWDGFILCEESEPDEVLAWMVCQREKRRVLWLSRKPRYNGLGLGEYLLQQTFTKGQLECAFVNPKLSIKYIRAGYDVRFRPYIVGEIMGYANRLEV